MVKLSEDRQMRKAVNRAHGYEAGTPSRCSPFPLIDPITSKKLLAWQLLLVIMIFYNMIFVPYAVRHSGHSHVMLHHEDTIHDVHFRGRGVAIESCRRFGKRNNALRQQNKFSIAMMRA